MKRFFASQWGGFAVSIALGLLFGLAVVAMVSAQDKTVAPQPLPESAKVKILQLQKHQLEVGSEYQACQARMGAIPSEYQNDQAQIGAAGIDALKEMKLDPAKFDVDYKNLTAIQKAATPEKKAEEPKK